MRPSPRLLAAAIAACAATIAAIVVTLLGPEAGDPTPADFLPMLVALAGLCVIGLAIRRSTSVAWLAVIAVVTIATLDLAAWGRANRTELGPAAWQQLAALVCLGTVAAIASAAGYAVERPRRLGRWVEPVAVAVVILGSAISLGVFLTLDLDGPVAAESPLGDLGLVTRSLIAGVLGLTALGILGDLGPAVTRTRLRLRDLDASPTGSAGPLERPLAGARILLDELHPGRDRAQRAAEVERSRIAAELHAEVIPVVRQALREAEAGGSPERFALALREVLAEVDELVADRQSITLEAFGLLAGIEWLAERIEDRSDVLVRIDVTDDDGDATDGRERPPKPVESAAFRVAQLALENVVRHAPGASAVVELSAAPRRVRLVVTDDGPGIDPDAAPVALANGRRGLADMRAVAIACGASVCAAVGAGGRGTVVRFDWPAG